MNGQFSQIGLCPSLISLIMKILYTKCCAHDAIQSFNQVIASFAKKSRDSNVKKYLRVVFLYK